MISTASLSTVRHGTAGGTMASISEVRVVDQELAAPDLKAIGAELDALRESFAALEKRQGASDERLLKAIAQSEEKILLTHKVALLSQQNEQLLKKSAIWSGHSKAGEHRPQLCASSCKHVHLV